MSDSPFGDFDQTANAAQDAADPFGGGDFVDMGAPAAAAPAAAPAAAHDDDPFAAAAPAHDDAEVDGVPAAAAAAAAPKEDRKHHDPIPAAGAPRSVDPFAADYAPRQLDESQTPLAKWEAERKVEIQRRIDQARADKQRVREEAQAAIKSFYKTKADTLAKTQAGNRQEEKNQRAETKRIMESGTLWEKVGRMTNLAPKAADDRKTRMRKLLLSLKNDGK